MKVSKFHVPALTVPLNVFTQESAIFTGVKVEDPLRVCSMIWLLTPRRGLQQCLYAICLFLQGFCTSARSPGRDTHPCKRSILKYLLSLSRDQHRSDHTSHPAVACSVSASPEEYKKFQCFGLSPHEKVFVFSGYTLMRQSTAPLPREFLHPSHSDDQSKSELRVVRADETSDHCHCRYA